MVIPKNTIIRQGGRRKRDCRGGGGERERRERQTNREAETTCG